jgi:rubrerythrin
MTKSALDVLKQGMNTELWGLRFYEQAVAHIQSEDGKRVFQSLVEEETKHLDILRGQYAAVSGSKKWISVQEALAMAASMDPLSIFPEASSAEQLIPPEATDEQALEMALQFEKRGFDLYDQAAKAAADPAAKTMWQLLAKAEDAHWAFLHETYEYLKTNGTWYFDAQEFPFFEG